MCVCQVALMVCAFNFSLVGMGEPLITLEESTGSRPPPAFQSWFDVGLQHQITIGCLSVSV